MELVMRLLSERRLERMNQINPSTTSAAARLTTTHNRWFAPPLALLLTLATATGLGDGAVGVTTFAGGTLATGLLAGEITVAAGVLLTAGATLVGGGRLTAVFGAGEETSVAELVVTCVPTMTKSGTTTGGGLAATTATGGGGGGGTFVGGAGCRNSGMLIAPGGKFTVHPMYLPESVRIKTTNGCEFFLRSA